MRERGKEGREGGRKGERKGRKEGSEGGKLGERKEMMKEDGKGGKVTTIETAY